MILPNQIYIIPFQDGDGNSISINVKGQEILDLINNNYKKPIDNSDDKSII